ncbi:DUF6723 family protein [Paraburkholderia aspalathi]|uniref:DUF6723 family protein n=1 Tax=Paraburkholderia aspalathi TaxID=1324617 RepID=UPI00313428B7
MSRRCSPAAAAKNPSAATHTPGQPQCTSDGRYVDGLRALRKSGRKILLPFDGAPEIGPYATPAEAREAAVAYGRQIIATDRSVPEK